MNFLELVKIEKEKVILVEGKTDFHFFEGLLSHIQKKDHVQVIEYQGKSNLPVFFSLLLKRGQGEEVVSLKSVLVTKDANNSFENTFKTLQNLLKKNGFNAPCEAGHYVKNQLSIKGSFFLMHGENRTGCLEDLYLQSLEKPLMGCISEYFRCLCKKKIGPNIISSKHKTLVALAAQKEADQLGYIAKKHYVNFEHPCFVPLINAIEGL